TARPARGRDRLPVSAAPALAGPAQRAGVSAGDRRACGRAPGRVGRAGGGDDDRERHPTAGPAAVRSRGAAHARLTRERAGRWRRELRRVVGGALNVTTARLMNRRHGQPPPPKLDLAAYRALSTPTPRDMAELLAGRSNRERGWLTEEVLRAAGLQ